MAKVEFESAAPKPGAQQKCEVEAALIDLGQEPMVQLGKDVIANIALLPPILRYDLAEAMGSTQFCLPPKEASGMSDPAAGVSEIRGNLVKSLRGDFYRTQSHEQSLEMS